MADIDLSIRHPDYDRMLTRWLLGFDFFRGGVHVLQPSQHVQTVSWQQARNEDASAVDSSPLRTESVFEWYTSTRNTYLHKHRREKLADWEQRCSRAYHFPVFRPCCNVFASAVLKTGPQRKVPGAVWAAFLEDVDLNGTTIDAHVREVLTLALVFGRMHGIVDMPAVDAPIVTMRDQLDAGLRPYVRPVSPFDLVNWALDENGAFRWAQIREDMPDTRIPGMKPPKALDRYRVWYADHWELWEPAQDTRSRRQRWNLTAEAPHPCRRVPLATANAHRGSRTMLGVESPLADVADIDRSVFNDWSLLDEIVYKQTFGILAVPRREGAPMPDLEVGPGLGLVYDAEGPSPSYLSPDAAQLAGLLDVIGQKLAMVRVAAEAGRGAAEGSKEARSAAAIGAEQGDRNNVMSSLAESMEAYEEDVYDLAGRWQNEATEPTVAYSRRFDLRALNAQIADLVQLATLQLGKKVMGSLSKPVVQKMLQESGATDEEIDETLTAVDAEMEKPEPAPPGPPSGRPMFGRGSMPSADEMADRRSDK